MTIPSRQQKNRSNLEANIPARVGLEVVAPTNVRAQQTDPTKLLDALDQWQTIQAHKMEKAQAKASELATALGARDASLNKVDESKLSDDIDNSPEAKAYRKGVTGVRSEAHGLRFINESRDDLAREASRPDFDYDEWRSAKLEQFYEASAEGQNPDALPMLNRYVAQFDQNMSSQHSAIKAKAQLQRATDGLADNLSEMVSSGLSNPAQLAQWRASRAADSGLDDSEVEDVMGSVLLDKLAQGDTNAFTLAEAAGLMKDHAWSTRFTQQQTATTARLERERIDALEADTVRTLQVRQQLGTLAERGQLTMAYLAKREQDGEITQAEVSRAWEQQLQAESKRMEHSRKALELAQQEDMVDQLSRTDQETIYRVAPTGSKLRRQVQGAMDKQYATGLTLALSEDPEQKAEGVRELTRVVQQAQLNGMKLDYLKSTFETADVHVPQRFERMGMLWEELRSQGLSDYLSNHVSAKANARMHRFGFLVRNGQSPTEAREAIARAPVKQEDAESLARINGRTIQMQAEKLSADMGLSSPGELLSTMQEFSTELYAQGALSEAPTLAAEMVRERYVGFAGSLVRRSWFPDANPQEPEELAEAWDDVKDAVLLPQLRATIGDAADDVRPVPDPNVPGQFFLLVPGVGFVPNASVSSRAILQAHVQRKRDAASKEQAQREAFRTQATPLELAPLM